MPTENLSIAHHEAECRFRELLAREGFAPPDEIERHPDELVFLWHEPKVAIVIELSGTGEPVDVRARPQ